MLSCSSFVFFLLFVATVPFALVVVFGASFVMPFVWAPNGIPVKQAQHYTPIIISFMIVYFFINTYIFPTMNKNKTKNKPKIDVKCNTILLKKSKTRDRESECESSITSTTTR